MIARLVLLAAVVALAWRVARADRAYRMAYAGRHHRAEWVRYRAALAHEGGRPCLLDVVRDHWYRDAVSS